MTENTFNNLPKDKGSYILILFMDEPTEFTIGKLGRFAFERGWYMYVGSAFGAGGLRGRLKHHLKDIVKPHWHIDYLRQVAIVQAVWYFAGETNYEHQWADILLSQSGAKVPAKRFGASDCRCETHLIYWTIEPQLDDFCEQTGLELLRYLT